MPMNRLLTTEEIEASFKVTIEQMFQPLKMMMSKISPEQIEETYIKAIKDLTEGAFYIGFEAGVRATISVTTSAITKAYILNMPNDEVNKWVASITAEASQKEKDHMASLDLLFGKKAEHR